MYNIIINYHQMESDSNQFLKIAERAATLVDFHQVVEDQEARMDLLSFQIHSLIPEKAIKTYKRVQSKYKQVYEQIYCAERASHAAIDLAGIIKTPIRLVHHLLYVFQSSPCSSKCLKQAIQENIDFVPLASSLFNKDPDFLLFHYLVLLKSSERMSWSQQRDQLLLEAINAEGMRWNDVSRSIFMKTNKEVFKSPKSCRERWLNHLDNTKVKGNWSDQEDIAILQYIVETSTKKWSKMVGLLDNKRTQHSIKNRFNMLVAKYRRYKTEKDLKVAARVLTNMQANIGNKTERQVEQNREQIRVQQNINEESQLQFNQLKENNGNNDIEKIREDEPVLDKPQEMEEALVKEQQSGQPQVVNNAVEAVQRESFAEGYYPFENYSYEQDLCNYQPQIFDFRTPIYYYQPIFTLALPTADTINREARILEERRQRRQTNGDHRADHHY